MTDFRTCLCLFPLLFSVFSVTWLTTAWWTAALLSTRCAPCSFTLTCRRSRTLPPAWGGMTSTSASAQVFTQHYKRITVQRLPFRVCAMVEFCVYLRCLQDKKGKERLLLHWQTLHCRAFPQPKASLCVSSFRDGVWPTGGLQRVGLHQAHQ